MLLPFNPIGGAVRPFVIGVTGLTITITISKAGGAFAAPAAPTLVEIGVSGTYNWNAAAGDLSTLGALTYLFAGIGLPATLGTPVDTVQAGATVSGVVIE